MTYSINDLTPITLATSYKISGSPSFFEQILTTLIDNNQKMITPGELRDSLLSLSDDIVFKQTVATGATGYTSEYIGIDNGNPNERDLKRKIFLGKRAYSGTYSYESSHEIMGFSNSVLLSSDYDTFFWNTKMDNREQFETKIKILAGSDFGKFDSYMPTIESQYVLGTTYSLSFNFINPSGDIDIRSEYGTVSISQISFPSIDESYSSFTNQSVLKYNSTNNQLYWDDISIQDIDVIGVVGEKLTIIGDPTPVNNYSLEFTDTRWSPLDFGDIQYGDSFENISLSEVLNRMIYGYLSPNCSIKLTDPYSSGYVEVGNSPTPILEYQIGKRTSNLEVTTLTNMIPGIYPPIISDEYLNVTSSSEGIVISPITSSTTIFTINVNDGSKIISASTSLTGVYPYFYGFSALGQMTLTELTSMSKMVEPKSDKIIDFVGTGNLYFMYPKIYGTLSSIKDDDGFDYLLSGSFSTPTVKVLNSPSGIWSSVQYYIYQWDNTTIGPLSKNFQFEY